MASGLTQQHLAPLVLSPPRTFHMVYNAPLSQCSWLFLLHPFHWFSSSTAHLFGVFQSPGDSFFFFVLHYFLSYFLRLFKHCLYADSSKNISSPDFSKYLEFPNGYCTQHLCLGDPGHLKLNISKTNLLISHPSHSTPSSIVVPAFLPTLPEAQGKSLGFYFLLPTPSLSVEFTSFALNIF